MFKKQSLFLLREVRPLPLPLGPFSILDVCILCMCGGSVGRHGDDLAGTRIKITSNWWLSIFLLDLLPHETGKYHAEDCEVSVII